VRSSAEPTPDPTSPFWRRPALELAVGAIALICALSPLFCGIEFSPDSVNFVVAAQNFLDHGEFFVFTNWPSHSLLPEVEPFTDFPPGYSLYLLPFLTILKDPFLAATFAQALAIVAFFVSFRFLMTALGWHPLLRIAAFIALTVFSTYPLIYGHYWTEPLFIACTLAVATCMVHARTKNAVKWWWWAALFAFAGSSLKYLGAFNILWFLIPIASRTEQRARRSALAVLACILPILLWFVRNELRYGRISFSHLLGEPKLVHTLLRPFHFLFEEVLRISDLELLSVFPVLAFLLLLVWPLWYDRNRFLDRLTTTHGMLVIATLGHSIGIWLLSLVTFFSLLDDRLLAPSITLGMVAALNGINEVVKQRQGVKRIVALALPFVFLLLAHHTTRPILPWNRPAFARPPELSAWLDLRSTGGIDSSTHFYSDRDFRHQLYARIPQRIIWDVDVIDRELIDSLLQTGKDPFFVLHTDQQDLLPLISTLQQSELGLQRWEYPQAKLIFFTPGANH